LILSIVREERPSSVNELVNILLVRPGVHLTTPEAIRLVQELREGGKIRLSEPPAREFSAFVAYLLDRNASASFWLTSAAVLCTWFSIYLLPSEYPWVILRWVLGTLFVIYLPGYAFIEALFINPSYGRKELDQIERFALSMGMSIALVPLVGLLLNYTPWGIRLEPIVISLSLLTLVCIFVATYRKYAQLSTEKISAR
jgi:uncharacterized membrane protein